jgi:hypothetical protein
MRANSHENVASGQESNNTVVHLITEKTTPKVLRNQQQTLWLGLTG